MTKITFDDENISVITSVPESGLTGSDVIEMFIGVMLNAGYSIGTIKKALIDGLEHINETIRLANENNSNE